MTKSKIEELFDTMVSLSDGVRRQLPEKIDPSRNKDRRGSPKPIKFVCVPNDPETKLSDCWVCVSHAKQPTGYIHYSVRNAEGKPKGTVLHRIIYQMWMGKELPPDLYACHECDVPFCINPAHIFPGTAKDNSQDMATKNRNLSGEKHPKAKLTEKDVWDIRLRHRLGGETLKALALEYGVSGFAASMANSFKTWKPRH